VTPQYALAFGGAPAASCGAVVLTWSNAWNGPGLGILYELEVVVITEELIIRSDRPLLPLLTAVEHAGGSILLLERGGRRARLARLVLPEDPDSAARCRELIDDWSTAGAWPLGHPRYQPG
jgi:hypothetical protein